VKVNITFTLALDPVKFGNLVSKLRENGSKSVTTSLSNSLSGYTSSNNDYAANEGLQELVRALQKQLRSGDDNQ
jgi:hypothetical protein